MKTSQSVYSKLVRLQIPFRRFPHPSQTFHTDPTDADAKYVHFFHEKIPSRFVVLISALYMAYIYWERADNSPNVRQLAFSTNSSKPSPNVSSSFAHGESSVHSETSMGPLSRILPMRLKKHGRYAKPGPSIATVVAPHRLAKAKATRGKKRARKS